MRLAVLAFTVACALAVGLPNSLPEPDGAPDRDARFADLARREAVRVEVADALLRRQITLGEAADWFGRLEPDDAAVAGRGQEARRAVAFAARLAAARPSEYPPGRVAELKVELGGIGHRLTADGPPANE